MGEHWSYDRCRRNFRPLNHSDVSVDVNRLSIDEECCTNFKRTKAVKIRIPHLLCMQQKTLKNKKTAIQNTWKSSPLPIPSRPHAHTAQMQHQSRQNVSVPRNLRGGKGRQEGRRLYHQNLITPRSRPTVRFHQGSAPQRSNQHSGDPFPSPLPAIPLPSSPNPE